MVYVEVAGQPLVILNDISIANEMLDKKSSIYSERPASRMGELARFADTLGLHPYNQRFEQMRRFAHKAIGTRTELERYVGLFESHIRKFSKALSQDKTKMEETLRHSVLEENDTFVLLADQFMNHLDELGKPGVYLVDIIPSLKHIPAWFPGAGFKRTAVNMREVNVNMIETPFQWTKKQMHRVSRNRLSYLTIWKERRPLKENTASSGSDTGVSLLRSFFLAMTLFPEVQSKAQDEIDRIIGSDRLPTLADHDSFPYVSPLVSELLRWACITPTAAPHRTVVDDTHRGYFIPKNSIVIANVGHMMHDPSLYPNPDQFSPERFLDVDGKPAEQEPRLGVFGFGRRSLCNQNLSGVSKVVKDGVEVTPTVRYTGEIIR
ncbi:cytochrome P450 [Gloeopeniophorella convolvens]|nr:cytochrome P450 [Gloeopeniophorella convolvens]